MRGVAPPVGEEHGGERLCFRGGWVEGRREVGGRWAGKGGGGALGARSRKKKFAVLLGHMEDLWRSQRVLVVVVVLNFLSS